MHSLTLAKNLHFAIVSASGIGDALLMQIAAAHLQNLNHTTITFSDHLPSLQTWFAGFNVQNQPSLNQIDQSFDPFDAIILQHDNTLKAKKIRSLSKPVYTLYGSHLISKHGPLRKSFDAVFDPSFCMTQNIVNACQTLFPSPQPSLYNGLSAPKGLMFRKFPKRIAIHPTSTSPAKNWPKDSFLKLHSVLVKNGWDPVFITSPHEAPEWGAPSLATLSELAAFLYESGALIGNDSGPGHLASNLGVPTLTIGPSVEHLTLWRPGWRLGEIVHPPNWVSKTKLTRNNWKSFISVNQVFKRFIKLTYDK